MSNIQDSYDTTPEDLHAQHEFEEFMAKIGHGEDLCAAELEEALA